MTRDEFDKLFGFRDLSQEASGRRLALARQAMGVTQPQLAEVVRKTKGAISNAEHGTSRVPFDIMALFYEKYDIDFNYFIAGDCSRMPVDVVERIAAFAAINAGPKDSDQSATK